MNKKNVNSSNSPSTSMIPLLFIGLLGIFAMQYFKGEPFFQEKKQVPQAPTLTSKSNVQVNKKTNPKLHDFSFPKFNQYTDGEKLEIQTDNFIVHLNTRGGRVDALYLKSKAEYPIPKFAIEQSKDEYAKSTNSIEVTLYQGLDFQPHLYYSGENSKQLGDPPLNLAHFKLNYSSLYPPLGDHHAPSPQTHFQKQETINQKEEIQNEVQEILYTTPIVFKNQKLELIKLYRFFKQENFFQQITILKNLEKKEFSLDFIQDNKKYEGSLFYKSFSDIGSIDNLAPASMNVAGRFFYYNNSLTQRPNIYKKDSGGGASCGSKASNGEYTSEVKNPNTLSFIGSHSRYFFGYNEFLSPTSIELNQPDGVVYKNITPMNSKETISTSFLNFRLAPKQFPDLSWKNLLIEKIDSSSTTTTPYHIIESLQKERRDALILNNFVYIGKRSNLDHRFKNPSLMKSFFNKEQPEARAEKTIYYSSYTALFSGVQDVILKIMHLLYKIVGNYGWSIVIIALAFKLLTFPLTKMQTQGMQKMSLLRPELDAINAQFADNPQEKQKRVMALFKKHNVNPAKGCLPMIIQMPIFVGLYSAFSSSMELWYSPFIFWMKDLSLPDSVATIPFIHLQLNILPLLMVSSQILYQRFTSVPTDSNQKMMMYIMPFIMLIFFWNIPSGVTLYWTLQNIISIAWQVSSKFFGKNTSTLHQVSSNKLKKKR